MANKRRKNANVKRDSGAFIALPMSVLHSKAYVEADSFARMLLFDLFAQYNGMNNGDFCAAWKLMKCRGWRSEQTLHRAKQNLLRLGLIVETRKGARPNKASLYAVTWCALDDCGGKLDMSPQSFPRGAYRLHDPATTIGKNAMLTTPRGVKLAG